MLSRIKQRILPPDFHPLADRRQLDVILKDVTDRKNRGDAVLECAKWLESISDEPRFSISQKIEIIGRIEAVIAADLRKMEKCRHRYIDGMAGETSMRFIGARYYGALVTNWRQALDVASFSTRSVQIDGKIVDTAQTILVGGLRGLRGVMDWNLAFYRAPTRAIWEQFGQFYRAVCATGQCPQADREVSAFMLDAITPSMNLTPARMELARRLTDAMHKHMVIGAEGKWQMDIKRPGPPIPIKEGTPAIPGAIRFGLSAAAEEDITIMSENLNKVPSAALQDLDIQADEILETVQAIQKWWTGNPPTRQYNRCQDNRLASVFVGFDLVRAELLKNESRYDELSGMGFFRKNPAGVESLSLLTASVFSEKSMFSDRSAWLINDVSESGVGARIAEKDILATGVGVLLAIEDPETGGISLGVVRRLFSDGMSGRRAGIEIISDAPIPIRIEVDGDLDWHPGILISFGLLVPSGIMTNATKARLLYRDGHHEMVDIVDRDLTGVGFECLKIERVSTHFPI